MAGGRGYAATARSYAANRSGAYGGRSLYTADRRRPYPVERGRYSGAGYGYPYGLATWYAPDYLGFPEDGFYDDSADYGATQPPEYVEAPAVEPEAYEAPPSGGYVAPQSPLAPEAAVTLIFKDGRPPQTIHNYLLTRTTLTVVQGQRQHDIAVADLDIAATVLVNKEAGVSFKPLP